MFSKNYENRDLQDGHNTMSLPLFFRIIRAPVPWHESYKQIKEYTEAHLFVTNHMMLELQNIWFDQ